MGGRAYYQDYLNKLRNGELTIPGGADNTDGAQQNDQAAMANQDPAVPAAPDQNVPASKVVRPGAVTNLLDQAQKSSAPSNGNTPPPTANASPMSNPVTSSAPAASNDNAPVTNSSSTDNPGGSPVTPATAAPQSSAPSSASAAPKRANDTRTQNRTQSAPAAPVPAAPAPSAVDQAVATIQAQQLTVLKEISKKLDKSSPTVKV